MWVVPFLPLCWNGFCSAPHWRSTTKRPGARPGRSHLLLLERDLLDRMIDKVYLLPDDMEIARIADTQGLGGTA